mmetsp:Transcript_42621/g.83812  ORF Transcript_42621/g.83812 Transcript_42621/m.83812 type:complete len:82 (-) Transcript_42621:123-368(-)
MIVFLSNSGDSKFLSSDSTDGPRLKLNDGCADGCDDGFDDGCADGESDGSFDVDGCNDGAAETWGHVKGLVLGREKSHGIF